MESMWRAEVTLESLEGLLRIGKDDFPRLSAFVTFSGSVPSMRVPSCSVCLQTGQLMIESEALRLDESKKDGLAWLGAKFKSSSPHLTAPLRRDQRFLQPSNASVNATVIDGNEKIIASDRNSLTAARGLQKPLQIRRGPSSVWSDQSVLPDIVELSVRLSCPAAQVGVAHLVVFSSEIEMGSYIMELPIKLKNDEDEDTAAPMAIFTSQSRLRVRVNLRPLRQSLASSTDLTESSDTPSLQASSSTSVSTDSFLKLTHSQLINEFGPILDTIKQNEKQALEHRQAQKRAMDVEIAKDGIGPSVGDFCAPFSWTRLIQNLSSAVRRCDANDHASVGSSICTNDSWEI